MNKYQRDYNRLISSVDKTSVSLSFEWSASFFSITRSYFISFFFLDLMLSLSNAARNIEEVEVEVEGEDDVFSWCSILSALELECSRLAPILLLWRWSGADWLQYCWPVPGADRDGLRELRAAHCSPPVGTLHTLTCRLANIAETSWDQMEIKTDNSRAYMRNLHCIVV